MGIPQQGREVIILIPIEIENNIIFLIIDILIFEEKNSSLPCNTFGGLLARPSAAFSSYVCPSLSHSKLKGEPAFLFPLSYEWRYHYCCCYCRCCYSSLK